MTETLARENRKAFRVGGKYFGMRAIFLILAVTEKGLIRFAADNPGKQLIRNAADLVGSPALKQEQGRRSNGMA